MSTSLPPGEPVWMPEDTVAHEVGKVEESADAERPAAVLWVPDPEQRHGWREYYVKKTQPKPGDRRMGYKRRAD
jgi:hypothetical protein